MSAALLRDILALRWTTLGNEYETDWPEDAQIVGAEWVSRMEVVRLYVYSETFDALIPGSVIPPWAPTYTVHHGRWAKVEYMEATLPPLTEELAADLPGIQAAAREVLGLVEG